MLNFNKNLDRLLHFDNEKVLKSPCQIVHLPLNQADQKIMQELMDYIKWSNNPKLNKGRAKHSAVGIAANQLGYNKAMFYINFTYMHNNNPKHAEYAVINPKICNYSQMIAYLPKGEGCLSVKDNAAHPGIVPRHYKIEAEVFNFKTKKTEKITLRGYEAVVFQHEFDHLQGKVYHQRINHKKPWQIEKNWQAID